MQCWYFLEDPNNERIRKGITDLSSGATSAESLQYIPRKWPFRVKVEFQLRPSETVCVVGSLQELGNWAAEKCTPLSREQNNPDVWSSVIEIPNKRKVEYRFCICIIIELGQQVVVKNWESNILPRYIEYAEDPPGLDALPLVYGYVDEFSCIDRGWLTKESAVHFKLFNNLLRIYRPKYANRTVFVKVTPIDLRKQNSNKAKSVIKSENIQESDKFAITEVACLNSEDTKLQYQERFGVKLENNIMVLFQITMLFPQNTAHLFDFYIYSSRACDEEPPYHIGYSYLLPTAMQASEGVIVLPVTSTKHRSLGDIRIEYVLIHPMKNYNCDMSATYSQYWNKTRRGLDVGHRGSGNSFSKNPKNCSEVRENTIASFKNAIDHGADYIEFDVHLSKDLTPVVYHDFHVCLTTKKKKKLEKKDMLEVPVKDLTFEQLRMLKVYHLTEGKGKVFKFIDDDLEDHQPFPTLRELFENLSSYVGFNIEIKYPTRVADGSHELTHPQDFNLFMDKILEDTFKYCGDRRIIFSCFNADICSAVKLKQNKYPVLFLTIGETEQWLPYRDPRCWSIQSACQFAQMIEILGVNVHTEDLLKNPNLVNHAFDRNLIIWCWGDDTADAEVITFLKDLGLHGVTYDKIHELYKDLKESIFLAEAKISQKDVDKKVERVSLVKRSYYIEMQKKSKGADLPYQNPNFYVRDSLQEDILAAIMTGPYPPPIIRHPEQFTEVVDLEAIRKHLPDLTSTATSLQSLESSMSDYKANISQ